MGRGDVMRSTDAKYRFRVAQGFLEESRQDVALTRWRSAVDNAQLATENAAKAVLALVGPVGRTHQPALLLRQALQIFSPSYQQYVERLSEQAEMLGFDVHVQTDYGDEMEGVTPWELFNEDDARSALAIAEEAVRLAQLIIEALNQ
jgi:HEPN domain-containing protein